MDSLSTILQELRLSKNETASKKAEVDKILIEITQDIRLASEIYTVSSARTANKKAIERTDAGATEAQPKVGTAETEENDDPPGSNNDDDFHFQTASETIQESVEVGDSRQQFSTLRPQAPSTFTGNTVELEE
jgi:hypothetical protein